MKPDPDLAARLAAAPKGPPAAPPPKPDPAALRWAAGAWARIRDLMRPAAARVFNLYLAGPDPLEWQRPYFQAVMKMQLPPGKTTATFPNEPVFDPLIREASAAYGVPVTLIKAIIAKESSFNPQAYRSEPAIRDASYGLMQILFRTAAGLGYTGAPEGLFDPRTNITWGTRYLRQLVTRFGDTARVIAAYNAGTPRRNAAGQFVNSKGDTKVQGYVDKVKTYLREFEAAEGAGFFLAAPVLIGLILAALYHNKRGA